MKKASSALPAGGIDLAFRPSLLARGPTRQGSPDRADGWPGQAVHEPVFKRPFDLLVSALVLVLTSPLWLVLAGWIRGEDGGPVLFRQARFGRNGEFFPMLKFRSMVVDLGNEEVQARAQDPRITRAGKFLRRTGLDELPQLWSIFVGHMSFVGPRPQPEKEKVLIRNVEKEVVVRAVPGFLLRQLVRPGLTGIAQLCARRTVEHQNKFRYDALYVKKVVKNSRLQGGARLLGDIRMLFFDLSLIFQTIWGCLRGKREI